MVSLVAKWLGEKELKVCHPNFTTIFTLKFTISKEICHLATTLGTISRCPTLGRRGDPKPCEALMDPVIQANVPQESRPETGAAKTVLPGAERATRTVRTFWNWNHAHLAKPSWDLLSCGEDFLGDFFCFFGSRRLEEANHQRLLAPERCRCVAVVTCKARCTSHASTFPGHYLSQL